MSIKQILGLLLTFFVILPLLAVNLISFESFKNVQTQSTVLNMKTASVFQKQRIAEELNLRINSITEIIDELGFSFDGKELTNENIEFVRNKFLSRCNEQYVLGMALYNNNNEIATVVDNQNGILISKKVMQQTNELKDYYISPVMSSDTVKDLRYIQIIVPIFSPERTYIGSISQLLDVSAFGDLLKGVNIFRSECESIINEYGEVFVTDSFTEPVEKEEADFFKNFAASKSEHTNSGTFYFANKKKLCLYQKINNIDWYYINVVDKSEIFAEVIKINNVIGIIILLIIVSLVSVGYSYAKRYIKKISDFTAKIKGISSGEIIDEKDSFWVCKEISNLSDTVKNLIFSASESKKRAADMLADAVAYKKAIEVTSILVFDASITKNQVLNCSNGMYSFSAGSCDEFIKSFASEYIHSVFQKSFIETFSCENLLKQFWDGKKFVSLECLFHTNEDSPYQWISINSILFSSETNQEVKTVFYLQNINERKEKELSAIEQSQVDPLTGVYNKKTTQEMINEYIYTYTGMGRAVFVIMDIDNFKSVNDTFGHIVGDDVICDVADRLKKQFRGYDVIGRIGGDEFVVFLKDIDDYDLITNIVANVITAIHYPIEMNGKSVTISVSAGISIFPDKGKSYNELYRQADSALYASKKAGKNRFSFYSGDSVAISHEAEEAVIGDDQLKMLYAEYSVCENIDDKRHMAEEILRYIGTKNNISRIYNIILDESQKNFYSTLEWCNEGIPHNMAGKAIRSLEMNDDYTDYFNEENVFACRDVRQLDSSYYNRLAAEGVIAILQYSEIKDGKIVSCVGFDDCREKRYWSDDMVKCLYLVKKLSEECY